MKNLRISRFIVNVGTNHFKYPFKHLQSTHFKNLKPHQNKSAFQLITSFLQPIKALGLRANHSLGLFAGVNYSTDLCSPATRVPTVVWAGSDFYMLMTLYCFMKNSKHIILIPTSFFMNNRVFYFFYYKWSIVWPRSRILLCKVFKTECVLKIP